MITRKIISEMAAILLILLFVYASASKLLNFSTFQIQMQHQPLPDWMTVLLGWTLLPVELITAGLLVFVQTRKMGLYVSFGLMILFTGYVALAVAKVFDNIPCVCGGVLASMDWEPHLVLNIFFVLIAFLGILTTKKYTKLTKSSEKQKEPRLGSLDEVQG